MRRAIPAAALVAALVVAGCGRDDDGADAGGGPEPIDEGPATGEITVWAMGTEGEELGALADEFMAENPDADVRVTPVPWDAAHHFAVRTDRGYQLGPPLVPAQESYAPQRAS
jgi:multiple sugar transport system substrate-binding protein